MAAVVPVISPLLAAALERNRPVLNARWPLRRPRGTPGEFLAVLAPNLDCAMVGVAGYAPDRVDAVCVALFDAALEMWAHGSLGTDAGTDAGAVIFQLILPMVPRLLASDPVALVGSLGNAVIELRREGVANPLEWAFMMAHFVVLAEDVESIRDAGAVVAWRLGLAHGRDAALGAFARMPAALALAAGIRCGVVGREPAEIARVLSRRWSATAGGGPRRLDVVALAGSFEAFGGPFRRPPVVRAAGGSLFAGHDDAWWRIHADDFGVVLRPDARGSGDFETGDPGARISADGTVNWRGLVERFAVLERAASWAATDDTLAVACHDSHRVRLLAVRGVGA